jgi:hypothetical protein
MSQDIDAALRGWEYEPGTAQARLVRAADGREVLQLRLDLGVLQMETTGRPDGKRPFGLPNYLTYLRLQARRPNFVLDDNQCAEADREFVQFYHRRISWLALRQYDRAVADADYTLTLMDFVRTYSPSDEYTQAHEQYRGFVLFHRTQAACAAALERGDAEKAIDAVRDGLERLRAFYVAHEAEDQMDEDDMVRQLRQMEQSLRQTHQIGETLQEQLARAVANEEYETAARLRDELRRRQ